ATARRPRRRLDRPWRRERPQARSAPRRGPPGGQRERVRGRVPSLEDRMRRMRIPHRRLRDLYRRSFRGEPRRERLFLASLAFFVVFGITRLITHAIRGGRLAFGNLSIHGQHLHHLVWGILLLLVVGYGWLIQIGSGG